VQLSADVQAGLINRAISHLEKSPLYQAYLNDPMSVDHKLRRIFETLAASDTKPNADEPFRLFGKSEINF
jgi:2-oxoglutarate dehydrogenase complex dehydrogenase (E1) component-like enzyme